MAATAVPAEAGQWIAPGTNGAVTGRDIDSIIAAEPLGPKENVKAVQLARNDEATHVLLQLREREPPHYHADSDISVLLLRGTGDMHLGEARYRLTAGDVVLIPRNTIHYFVNTSAQPAAALVIYTPPPGPNDRVLVPPSR